MSIRQPNQRKFAFTNDLGKTWYYAAPWPDVKDSGSNGEIKRYTSVIDGYDKNRIIHSISYAPSRKNVSLMISYDEGLTWPYKRSIEVSPSCYSAITIDNDGNILVLYEDEGQAYYDIVLANLTLDWLTFGNDHYTKPNKLNWCLSNKAGQDNNCPSGSYKFNSKVFDQYVESYTLYPKDMTYTFTEEFRDFYVDLDREGLNKGTYNNLNTNKNIKIDFRGSRKENPVKELVDGSIYHEIEHFREFSFINVDPTFTSQNYKNKKITLKNSNLVIKGVGNATIFYGTNSIIIKQNKHQYEETTINIVSGTTNNILIETNDNITLRKSSKSLSLLADSSLGFTIKPINDKSSIIVEDSWTKDEVNQINFESGTGSEKVQVIVNNDNKDAFEGADSNFDIKDATPEPTPEIQYVETISVSETVSVSVSATEIEKEVIVEKNVGVSLPLAIGLALGLMLFGIIATTAVFCIILRTRRKESNTIDLDPLHQPLA